MAESHDPRAIVATLCERIIEGETVTDVCASLGINRGQLWRWTEADESLRSEYARARSLQAHAVAEQALHAAHGMDAYAQAVELVLACEEQRIDELPDKERQAAYSILNSLRNAAVSRDKLRVDTLKWTASKMSPRDYGEKQAVEHSGAVGSYVAEVPVTEPDAAVWAARSKPR